MSSLPSTSQPVPAPQRSANVILGNQGFVSVLLRSTAGELYKIRRRAMSKVLLLIGVALVVISFTFIALAVFLSKSSRSLAATTVSTPLHLPASLTTTGNIISSVALVLIIVLAGTIVGGEYGVGTIRVLLTRGPSRTQYLLAKILAIIVSIVITMVILIPVGILVGALYTLLAGISVDFSFFTGTWLLHAIMYILLIALNLFLYAMIALWLATLGKSTAAGIAGAVLWWFIEGLLSTILILVGVANPGTLGDILRAIPDYFITTNISALITEQQHNLTSYGSSSSNPLSTNIPDWRAWLVITVYLVVFLGITWLVLRRRDITN